MRHSLLTAGIILCTLAPLAARAAPAASLFDLYYQEAEQSIPTARPTQRLADYVVQEMEHWQGRGIKLTVADIEAALSSRLSDLCRDKKDMDDKPLEFVQGGSSVPGSCMALWEDLMTLLTVEQVTEQLGSDLLTLANGSELALSDEPHRPMDMATLALAIRRIWSGTGASVIPWDGSADPEVAALNSHLGEENVDRAILRFRHGYFRDKRENDPRFSGVEDVVRDDLRAIANKIGVTGNPEETGVFTTPKLAMYNVALWARRDDLGLMWVYPSHTFQLEMKPADKYPEAVDNGEFLAYPFAYEGGTPPAGPGITTPLCSRMIGRKGYLCQGLPPLAENCQNPFSNKTVTLVKCSEKVTATTSGPAICADFTDLFDDTGEPLVDPADPGLLNPALQETDTATICSPGKKVLYQDDITSHACYVSHCVLQSLGNGHSLIANRNPVVFNEAASPYLACVRSDPQLGLYTEIAEDTPYPLPEYLGQFLVRDFDRQYCVTNGHAPHPLAGLCAYRDTENARAPVYAHIFNAVTNREQGTALDDRQTDMVSIPAAIGQRAALDQSIELERKIFARLAHFIQHTADVLTSLERATLTKTPCPWTGPFKAR